MTHTAVIRNEGDEVAWISYDGSDHPDAKDFARVPVDLVLAHEQTPLPTEGTEFARYRVRVNDLKRPDLFECELSWKFNRDVVRGTAHLARERFNRRGAVVAIITPGDMTRYEVCIVDTDIVGVQGHGDERHRGEWWMSSSFGSGYPLSPEAHYTGLGYVLDHYVDDKRGHHTAAVLATFIRDFRAYGDHGG